MHSSKSGPPKRVQYAKVYFWRNGESLSEFKAYCDKLVGVGRDEFVLMRFFSRCLSGESFELFTSYETRQWPNWKASSRDLVEQFSYNVEIVPNCYYLENMKQNSNENYKEFSYRWLKEAARVRPPMFEEEIVKLSVRVKDPE